MDAVWITKQLKQATTYPSRWTRMCSSFVWHNIGSNHFENGSSELDDLPPSGRPLKLDVDLLNQLIEKDPRLSLRCLAQQLECSYTAMGKHLSELGKP